MTPDEPTLSFSIRVIAYALFASVGGIVGHLMRTLDKKEKIQWFRALLEGIAAGFVGLLILFACRALNVNEQWTGVIVGVSGWLGASTSIKILELIVRKKLGLSKGASND